MSKKTAEDTTPGMTEAADEATQIADEVDEISTEAKKSFSLTERVKGVRRFTKKRIPVILDEEAAARHTEANEVAKRLAAAYEAAKLREGESPAVIEALLERFNDADGARELILQEVLQSTFALQLEGGPAILVDRATRAARKHLGIKPGSTLTDDEMEDFREEVAFQNFRVILVNITDCDGDKLEFGEGDLREFRRGLPASQRFNLDNEVQRILFRDAVAERATDDPGF